MIAIHIEKVRAEQRDFTAEIERQRTRALQALHRIDRHLFDMNEQTYLALIIQLFEQDSFLLDEPNEIANHVRALGEIPPNSRFDNNGRPMKNLSKYIQEALGYKGLRDTFYPKYFQKIGIKACVYCNSQLTVTVVKSNNEYRARFEVDHHYPKEKYPFLAISLFNLYPSCSSCNGAKSQSEVDFELYSEESNKTTESSYSFELNSHSKALYLITRNNTDISFSFNEPPIGANSKSFKDTFHIREIYQTQQDIAEELILKSMIYNEAYKDLLRRNFSKLSLNQRLFERVLIGNYISDKDIHKRPMAKFTQDIARQLKLIK